MSLSIYPLPRTSTRGVGGVPIYPLADNIIFPCICMSRRCRYNPLPDNFNMRCGRYIYPLSTVITYTMAAPPRPSRSTKTLEDTQTLERKRCWSPTPSRRAPTRQINSLEATQIYQVKRALSSRPPQTLKALCRGDPKP